MGDGCKHSQGRYSMVDVKTVKEDTAWGMNVSTVKVDTVWWM